MSESEPLEGDEPELSPAERKAEQIRRINEISQLARTAWFTLLGYLVFVGITLLGVKDADFFVPSRQTDLPLVNVAIPTASFFWTAPVLGAALYIYLHLFLIKLWDAHVPPTKDSDGTHHWLVGDFVLYWQGDPETRRRPLAPLTDLITRLLVWMAAPLVLAYAWWRSMPAHDECLTLVIGACLWLTLVVGFTSWFCAEERLRPRNGLRWWARALIPSAIISALLLIAISWVRTEGGFDHYGNKLIDFFETATQLSPFADSTYPNGDEKSSQIAQEEWVDAHFATLDDLIFLGRTPLIGRWIGPFSEWSPLATTDLSEISLVPLPPNWRPPEVARADFREAWCRREGLAMSVCDQPVRQELLTSDYLKADRLAWCVEHGKLADAVCASRFADLDARFATAWDAERESTRANLPALDLRGRDLRHADAVGISLIRADLREARMEGANLRGARMEGANLRGALMEGAVLTWARMEGADLSGALMKGASLRWARLEGANLRGADLRDTAWAGEISPSALAYFTDFRRALGLYQAHLENMIGNADTLLPMGNAPDTGQPYYIWDCWEAPSASFEALIGRIAEVWGDDPKTLQGLFSCGNRSRQKTGRSLPFDAPYPPGHPLAERGN